MSNKANPDSSYEGETPEGRMRRLENDRLMKGWREYEQASLMFAKESTAGLMISRELWFWLCAQTTLPKVVTK